MNYSKLEYDANNELKNLINDNFVKYAFINDTNSNRSYKDQLNDKYQCKIDLMGASEKKVVLDVEGVSDRLALFYSAKFGHMGLYKAIRNKPNITTLDREISLLFAMRNNRFTLVTNFIVKENSDFNLEVLKIAIINDNAKMVNFIMKFCPSKHVLNMAIREGAMSVVLNTYTIEDIDTGFIIAAYYNQLSMIKLLLSLGAKKEFMNYGAFYYALKNSNYDIIEYFLQLGIPEDHIEYGVNVATLNDRLDILLLLIKYGGSV